MSHIYTEILKRIEDPSLSIRAVSLLQSPNSVAQEAAVELLAKFPSAAALDKLWEIRCSLEGDKSRFLYLVEVEAALSACIKLMPEWLLRMIPRTDPSKEPFAALVYLFAQLEEVEGGEEVWRELRETVFEKTPPEERRAILYASEAFRDVEAMKRYKDTVREDDDLIAPAALRLWGLIDPPTAIAALAEAPFVTALLFGRAWWLPQLLSFDYKETSTMLRRRIESHENPWTVAGVYDGHQNLITPEILDFLLQDTHARLKEAVSSSEPERRDRLARPLRFLAKTAAIHLLARFEVLQGTAFEDDLVKYLVAQGPNDEGWYRWTVWDGITVLQRIGGRGFTRLANFYLEAAQTRLGIRDGLILGIQRPDDTTRSTVRAIANDPEKGGALEEGFPLVQYEAVKALAALADWREMAKASMRLGLKTPRSLPEYFPGHVWTDEELDEVLPDLFSDTPSSGAILTAGFSRRPLGARFREIYESVEKSSEQALACLLSLELLAEPESEPLFLENLDSPQNGWVAARALHALNSQAGNEALLDRLATIGDKGGSDQQLLAMNLLIRQDTRQRAAELLWKLLEDREDLLYYTADTLEYFSVLDDPQVRELLISVANTDQRNTWHGGSRHAAIKALMPSEPEEALRAAKALFLSDDPERLLCPETLLQVNREEAIAQFRKILPETEDFLLLAAISEAMDRQGLARIVGD